MNVLGNYLCHLLLGVLVLLDYLLQQLVKTADGLVVLLQRVRHHQHVSVEVVALVGH